MIDQALERLDELIELCMDVNNPILTQAVNEAYSQLSLSETIPEFLELSKEIRILVDEVVEDGDDKDDIIEIFETIDEMVE
jgi:hypothetical protein